MGSNPDTIRPASQPTQLTWAYVLRDGLAIRILCAVVLSLAAAFKLHQLFSDPLILLSPAGRWLQFAMAAGEICLAGWLLSGLASLWARRTALCLFLMFAGYSLYRGAVGAASCGCFGKLSVNPWLMLLIDLGCLMAIFLWKPESGRVARFGQSGGLVLVATLCLAAIAGLVLTGVALSANTHGIYVNGTTVVLQPESWVGKRFPLVDEIAIADDLTKGSWTVIFYRCGCLDCESYLALYRHPRTRLQANGDMSRIALIQVPSSCDERPLGFEDGAHGSLNKNSDWLMLTPVELSLVEGRVIACRSASG